MGKIRGKELNEVERQELESGLGMGKSHAFRQRCQLVLLKSEGRSCEQVGQIVKLNAISVNNWLSRYQTEDLAGLKTKAGRGRKPVRCTLVRKVSRYWFRDLASPFDPVARPASTLQREGSHNLLVDISFAAPFTVRRR